MYLGQRIPAWFQDTKENKYSWPWNITCVLWFLIHSKGQMSRFPLASSKTIIMIKMIKWHERGSLLSMIQKWLLCNFGLRRDNHWFVKCHGQHSEPIKSGTNPHPLQPLGHPQPRQKQDHKRHKMKVLFFSLLLWFVPPKKRKLSQVSQRYEGWSDLGGSLGVCVCVCVSLLGFCYVDL